MDLDLDLKQGSDLPGVGPTPGRANRRDAATLLPTLPPLPAWSLDPSQAGSHSRGDELPPLRSQQLLWDGP